MPVLHAVNSRYTLTMHHVVMWHIVSLYIFICTQYHPSTLGFNAILAVSILYNIFLTKTINSCDFVDKKWTKIYLSFS